jgi:hypothetical protein
MIPVYTDAAHGYFDMQTLVSFCFLFWFIGKQRECYEAFGADVIRVNSIAHLGLESTQYKTR